MKKLILTEDFKKTQKVEIKKGKEPEELTLFYLQTMQIINSGQLQYQNMQHYRTVRKAVKALTQQKAESVIVFEDADYRAIFGTDDAPGILRSYGGWFSGDSTDEYLDIWENAETASIQVVKSLGKSK